MSDLSSTNASQSVMMAEIILIPSENEEDDFETLSVVEDVMATVLGNTSKMQDYTAQIASDDQRSAGVILLLGQIAHQVITQKDLIIAFLQVGAAAISVLAKQRHVSKIEMSLDGDSINIEQPDTATAQVLLDLYEVKHRGITAKVKPSSKLQVMGKVSKKEHRVT